MYLKYYTVKVCLLIVLFQIKPKKTGNARMM